MDRHQLQDLYEAYVNVYERKGEEDHEVSMIRAQLHSIMKSCETLMDHMKGGERDVEAWVQAKITKAEGMLQGAANYIESGESTASEEYEYFDEKIATGTGKKVMPSASDRSKLAKRARAGEDIGHKGKGFEEVAAKAAKRYGSKEAGERVAAAAMFRQQAHKEDYDWSKHSHFEHGEHAAKEELKTGKKAKPYHKPGTNAAKEWKRGYESVMKKRT
jgi:hypothetical protein